MSRSSSFRDRIRLRGRQRFAAVAVNSSGLIGAATPLTIASLGDRPAAVGATFLRYRYVSLRFIYRSATSSATNATNLQLGNLVIGVSDDVAFASGPTADQILNLRTSRQTSIFRDVSFEWRPVDRSKWYYVGADPTTSDARFTTPGSFAIATDVAVGTTTAFTAGTIDVEYAIEFEGATIVAV
jgi:hypothetical protein